MAAPGTSIRRLDLGVVVVDRRCATVIDDCGALADVDLAPRDGHARREEDVDAGAATQRRDVDISAAGLDGFEDLLLEGSHRIWKEVVASIHGQSVHDRHTTTVPARAAHAGAT
jgi:hypothetical protein